MIERVRRPVRRRNARLLARLLALALVALGVLALAGCGESSQEKAEKQVCSARNEISKEIKTLESLTLTSTSVEKAKTGFESIKKNLEKIKAAQPNLSQTRKEQVQKAAQTFESQIGSIASGLTSSLSLTNAEAQFKTALTQLGNSFKQAFAPVNCPS
jgi:phosphoglycerate-specific signal transduction histidine kinase